MQIDITAYGFEENERALVQLIALTTDLRPFWPRLRPLFIGWMGQQFKSEGAWAGGTPDRRFGSGYRPTRTPDRRFSAGFRSSAGWAELTPQYALWKQSHYPGKGILVAEGDLQRAALNPAAHATPLTYDLVIEDDIAQFHQDGTDTMVARPLVPDELPGHAVAQVIEVAQEYVSEMVDRLGLS